MALGAIPKEPDQPRPHRTPPSQKVYSILGILLNRLKKVIVVIIASLYHRLVQPKRRQILDSDKKWQDKD